MFDISKSSRIYHNPLLGSFTISCDGVDDLLSNINPSKSDGLDNLLAHFLKEINSEIAPNIDFSGVLYQGIAILCQMSGGRP